MNINASIWLLPLVALSLAATSSSALANDPYNQRGKASHYRVGYQGVTASGEHYDPNVDTAAHASLPFGTWIRVTHLRSGRSVIVRVNDRSAFNTDHVVDISQSAAVKLGIMNQVTDVAVTVVQMTATSQPRPVNNPGVKRLIPVTGITAEQLRQNETTRYPLPMMNSPEDGQSINRPMYRVQLGACADWASAEETRKQLARNHIGAMIVQSANPKFPFKVVSTSMFLSQGEAAKWISAVNAETDNRYADAFITR